MIWKCGSCGVFFSYSM